jgi:hypothetical protein
MTSFGRFDPSQSGGSPSCESARRRRRRLDEFDDDPGAVPAHVIEFGTQVDIQGVISGSDKSDKALRYLTKYLTESIGETAEPETPAAATHMDRLVEALRWEPCSESCPTWLLHGSAGRRSRGSRACAPSAVRGAPGLHFHDLRHTGNLFAAQSGASTADLMARMGHDDVRAALIYQRATREADRRIADRISDLVGEQRGPDTETEDDEDGDDGAAGALVPAGSGPTVARGPSDTNKAQPRVIGAWACDLRKRAWSE